MTIIGTRGVNALGVHRCVGYFDEAGTTEPAFDPGWGDTPCLICWKPLGGVEGDNVGGNIRTLSVLHGYEAAVSLFYRLHITCADANPDEIERIDASVMHGEGVPTDPREREE